MLPRSASLGFTAALACLLTFAATIATGQPVIDEAELRSQMSDGTVSTITFAAGTTITLSSPLPRVSRRLEINGENGTIDGAGLYRVFFVAGGSTLVLNNLVVRNGGAAGGAGAGSGGGGLGAGGGLFVDEDGSARLTNVSFQDNAAVGGAGGGGEEVENGGGGGGLGGDGGSGAGGGGGFLGAGGSGSVIGEGAGGGGGDVGGQNGDDQTGGDGGGSGGTTGGVGGGVGQSGSAGSVAGVGGGGAGPPDTASGSDGGKGAEFGGGGGATGNGSGGAGGAFGGGGGSRSGTAGAGGYGGGGGGTDAGGTPGVGGFGAGDGTAGSGGNGGRGLGGAVFVRAGGSLEVTLGNVNFGSGNSVTNGAGGSVVAAEGQDLFVEDATAQITVENGADTAHITRSIGGGGGIEKLGAGTLILQGTNTYTGGTQVSDGTLSGNSSSIQGNVSVSAGRVVVEFDESGSGTFSGVLSGAGNMRKTGAGSLTLTGDNTIKLADVNNGELIGDTSSLPSTIVLTAGDSIITFDQATDATYTGFINGTGSFRKRGVGTLTLPSAGLVASVPSVVEAGGLALSSGASLATDLTVNAGATLSVAGMLTGSLTVNAGALLSGTGTVDGDLTTKGRIEPGGSIGTLTVTGDAVFETGSVLSIEADDTGSSDLLDVSGTVTRTGGTLELILLKGNYSQPKTYTVVRYGTFSGLFPGPTDNLVFLDGALTNNPIDKSLQITVDRNSTTFQSAAHTPNQAAVGGALDEIEGASDPLSLLSSLYVLTSSEVSSAFDSVAGASLSAFETARLAGAKQFRDTVVRRFGYKGRDARTAALPREEVFAFALQRPILESASPFAFAGGARRRAAFESPPNDLDIAGWLDGWGVFGDVDGDGNAGGYDYSVGGTSFGVDWSPVEGVVLGAAGSYARTRLQFDAEDATNTGNTWHAALYAAYTAPRFYVGGLFRYAYSDFESRRRLLLPDTDETALADLYGNELGAYVEGGVAAAKLYGVKLQPMASVDYSHLQRGRFSEHGAGVYDLLVSSIQLDSLLLSAGARAHGEFEFEEDYVIAPELWARWSHEFGDTGRRIEARLRGFDTGTPFSVKGVELARDSAHLGAGWSVRTPQNLHAFIHYEVALNSDFTSHGIRSGVLVRW